MSVASTVHSHIVDICTSGPARSVCGNGLEVVSGGIIQDLHLDRVNTVEYRPEMILTSVPSFGKTEVQWIVRGSGKATVIFDSIKARNRSIQVQL